MISNDTILDIIQNIASDKTVQPAEKSGPNYGCYRIHFTNVFGNMVDSRDVTSDNHIGAIIVDGQEYHVEFDYLTMWFTCRPV